MNIKEYKESIENEEYQNIIQDIILNDEVKKMKKYKQHFNTSCYEHCYNVSYFSYKIAKKINWDYVALARAGMLHDFFLYDWRKRENGRKGHHAFTHGKEALKNASKIFDLSEIEKDIILKHMWPVTLALPSYKETFLITLVDKYCAIIELEEFIKNNKKIRREESINNLKEIKNTKDINKLKEI